MMVPYREPIVYAWRVVSVSVSLLYRRRTSKRKGLAGWLVGWVQASVLDWRRRKSVVKSMATSEVCGEVYSVGSLSGSVDGVERARANGMSQGHEPNNEAQWTPRRWQGVVAVGVVSAHPTVVVRI